MGDNINSLPCDDNTQPYHTGSVAARVNKDRAFGRTSGRRCQVCYWCIIEDSRKKQRDHRHLEQKDTTSCRETSETNTRNGQLRLALNLNKYRERAKGSSAEDEIKKKKAGHGKRHTLLQTRLGHHQTDPDMEPPGQAGKKTTEARPAQRQSN